MIKTRFISLIIIVILLVSVFPVCSQSVAGIISNQGENVSYLEGTTKLYDFNDMPDWTDKPSADGRNSFKYLYPSCGYDSLATRVAGASGEEGDYAVYIEYSGNKPSFYVDDGNSSQMATTGKIIYDFDLKLDSSSYMSFLSGNDLWSGSTHYLVEWNTLVGTTCPIPAGKWVNYNMVYDLTDANGDTMAGKWYVTITVDGVSTLAVDGLPAVDNPFRDGSCITLKNWSGVSFAIDNFSITNVTVPPIVTDSDGEEPEPPIITDSDGEEPEPPLTTDSDGEGIIIPRNGELLGELPKYFKAVCSGAETIIFELDGVSIGQADSEGNISVPADITYGKHDLKAVAVFSDGTAEVNEAEFVYYQHGSFNKSIQNFDLIPDVTDDDTCLTDLRNNFNFMVYTNQSTVSRITGSSSNGSDGDYALYVEKKISNGSNESRLVFDETKSTVYATNGQFQLDFDLMLTDPNQEFRFFFYPLWYNGYVLVSGGKIAGTNTVFPANKWVRFNMVYDMSGGNGSLDSGVWTVNVTIDGVTTTPVNSVRAVHNAYQSGVNVLFSMKGGTSTVDKPIAMAIDNFSLTSNYYGIKKCTYIKSDAENEITSKVPCDAKKIKVYLNEEITSLTKNDVSLVTDGGVNVPVSDIVYNATEKYIEITPEGKLPSNTGITVKLSPELVFRGGPKLGKSHTARFETSYETLQLDVTFKKGATTVHTARQLKSGDVVSAELSVKNLSVSPKAATYILSVRDNKKLAGISSKTIQLQPGETQSFTITLPQLTKEGDYTIYLINMESLSTGLYVEDYIELK